MKPLDRRFAPALVFAFLAAALPAVAGPAPAVEQVPDGILFTRDGVITKVQVCSEEVVRIARSRDRAFFAHPSLAVGPSAAAAVDWRLDSGPQFADLRTSRLTVHVDLSSGAVSFADASGKALASEDGAGSLDPAEVQGVNTFHVRQRWKGDATEALYGLGQQQLGLLDIKGYDLDLWQHNGTVAVPFLVSSRGYGILWDNPSFTRFGDLRPFTPMPPSCLFGADGKPGGLTATYFADDHFERRVDQRSEATIDIAIPDAVKLPNHDINPALPSEGACSVRWEGFIVPETGGIHTFESYSNCGIRLWVDGRLVMDHWRQGWLPWKEESRVALEAGRRHPVKLEWTRDEGMPTVRLGWKTPSADTATSLWSEVGEGVDYYFVYGPQLDRVISGYRKLTGAAPMMPAWTFGFWQSRERYETSEQSLDVVRGYRSRSVPFDTIVQDWRYWPASTWGSHDFDKARFPDPDGWIRSIHELHAHLVLSVWGKFETGTDNFRAMHDAGFLYGRNLAEGTVDWLGDPYTFYDAFNPGARRLLWEQMDRKLFRRGVDAWWMDATEPDLRPTPTLDGQRDYATPTALGPASRVLNAYPLMNSAAVYEGQRASAPDKRVFILTRSGFAGEQRYAAAVWSGDTSTTWTSMSKQITAGLGFCLSGLPYWTMDSGGFSVPSRFSAKDAKPEDVAEWRELNTRWFEFATFVPFLRAHGQYPLREMWEMGGDSSPAFAAQVKFDRLRYRLFPYIYSLAGAVTQENGTIMRALVMDFASDAKALDVRDEYMFGPALLVNPVTSYGARSRTVYLPGSGLWYDFWSGAAFPAGTTVTAPAPFDAIPIFVRAGSILPTGPDLQYIGEKPSDPTTLRVYAGADGDFTLYEDDGATYGYEHGAFTRIALHWDNARRTLVIGARTGAFPGMLRERTFEVVLAADAGSQDHTRAAAAVRVHYTGDAVSVPLP